MPARKVISSSLYPQHEIEIEGTAYKVKPLNRAVFDAVADLQKAIAQDDPGAAGKAYDQVGLLLDAPQEVINALDYRAIRDIMTFITDMVVRGEAAPEEKKEPEPGNKPSH